MVVFYDKFKYWVHIAESVCITETTLTAFCKNVESGLSVYWLKCLGHLYYGDWLISLLLYLNREIIKEQLYANLNDVRENFVQPINNQPYNLALMKIPEK